MHTVNLFTEAREALNTALNRSPIRLRLLSDLSESCCDGFSEGHNLCTERVEAILELLAPSIDHLMCCTSLEAGRVVGEERSWGEDRWDLFEEFAEFLGLVENGDR